MHLKAVLALTLALLASAAPAQAEQPPDRTISLTPDKAESWKGPAQVSSYDDYNAAAGEQCTHAAAKYCDVTLINAGDPGASFYNNRSGALKIDVAAATVPSDDFDLYVYKSDANGARGELVDSSAGLLGESVTIPNPSGYYRVQVLYYTTAADYTGTARLTYGAATPPNPDVDVPPGLQEALASDPALGYRSHSEPHIAQSPTNPNIMIAGSKEYNRDPDSLKEYEFKIGTYVSFDRGQTWKDLGQIDLCPQASDAPPASWPDQNTCYPGDDPALAGTGAEDAKDPRAKGDYGEEYVVSDVWIDFDDEGNAYAMVLDSPPFADGAGFGMTMHKWASPSPQDVKDKTTWGPRVIINDYPQEKGNTGPTDNASNPLGFLDDKNTFAVNNAGQDGDGKSGTILACWGQNISTAIKQQVACERSTDGARSFPDPPKPVSGAQQLVLGVATVADRKDPGTFYVYWKGYESSLATGALFDALHNPGVENDDLGVGLGPRTVLLYGVMTRDGGQTFTPPQLITTFDDLASPLPDAQFRTTSIPQATQAPDGSIYIVYDAYNLSPKPGDADGRNADAMLIKSTNGLTFSKPVKVNQDTGNADQVQAQVAADPQSRVYVSYFDSRLTGSARYLDRFLSTSEDGGKTFTDHRLSHDSSDTAKNPPISTSGQFFGDYQGLVADACGALAFYNDTHLANDAGRDPDFDKGLPRSEFQQVMATRFPSPEAANNPACARSNSSTVPGGGRACAKVSRFTRAAALPRGRQVKLVVGPRPAGAVTIDIFQVSHGRRVLRPRRVASFTSRRSLTWNGHSNIGKKVSDGYFVVRMRSRAPGGGNDVRRFALHRSRGRFGRGPRYAVPNGCTALSSLRLDGPVFGGRGQRPLRITLRLRRAGAIALELRRGTRVVQRMGYKATPAGRTQRRVFFAPGLRPGIYSVRVRVRRPGERVVRTVYTRRL